MIARYTVSLTIDIPIDADEDASSYTTQQAKTALEKNVLHLMRRSEGDSDCEVMAVELVEEN